jgi:4-hydroxyproline epimerase
MCGHGTIGLAVTLAHLGRIAPGIHRIETPAGMVEAELHNNGEVTLHNVPSYRSAAGLALEVPRFGKVTGDVAWGGNWFFLTHDCPCELRLTNLEPLTDYTWAIRQELTRIGHPEIDHIELCGPPLIEGARSKNFVLCPGRSYDRSPCGTGTSAWLACLYADGQIGAGEVWRQESLIGTTFDGWVTVNDGAVFPHIRGAAFVTAEAHLILNEQDPLRWGIRGAL